MRKFKIIFAIAVITATFAAACAPPPDPFAYQVTDVMILRGQESHFRDADTFIIIATNGGRILRAEGSDPVHTGEVLCENANLLQKKIDPNKACTDDMSFDVFYEITEEKQLQVPR